MATIRYFLPEDGDREGAPNVFISPKPSRPGYPPLLGQIKGSFPLPGAYHFRFKTALVPGTDRDKHAVPVWMDCVDDSEPVPVWQNSIIAKVTRIGMDDDDDFDDDFARAESNISSASVHSAPPQPKSATETAPTSSIHSSDSLLGAFDEPPAPAPAAPAASSVHSSTENLLDVDHHPPAPASGGSLLDMDHLGAANSYRSSGPNTPTQDHSDLLNMSAPIPSQPPATHPPQGGAMPAPPVQQRPQPMQQGRPPQQAPMQGQYPMQYPPQGQYAAQGRAQMPASQQQRNQQNGAPGNKNAFEKFSGNSLDPLGNLNWNLS
mmetsp:Transcript_20358/g.43627  ORF Transcript_20358/g.43627 Transcript_20358/m.43627 type:complete len:320 (-) Transcript_20358:95-1054(-)|eukprot:CAMPEP_0172548950 /NCGR_PEP_ID=MMETSP1067-20121228/18135_1 /TAXON_ID=265564 ORGANISM="Thalassiosira punctigera, Strain Tpunct2005C2" /NCGR_SAMPLE_ID=MMETSP1067 /ASSEMBLY_ACC=CAM_ASM_000444 /LENGTH=319 /DNA_ID=CAMNT_0013336255 /DNA_START=227 /DNA_END=1186 /DNA_ORIENTATION=+